MTDWTKRYLELATFVSKWSDKKKGRGAVVVSNSCCTVVAIGWDTKYGSAEDNALDQNVSSAQGFTLFSTHPPCFRLMKRLEEMQFTKVVYKQPSERYLKLHADDLARVTEFASGAGIKLEYYPPNIKIYSEEAND